MSVHLATGPFCDNINTMDNLSAHFRGAIEDVEADFDHNYFSLQINACLPDNIYFTSIITKVNSTYITKTGWNFKTTLNIPRSVILNSFQGHPRYFLSLLSATVAGLLKS